RFYRIDKTGNRNDGGSGLGLAIVKWIVDAHHGSVNVSSSLGQGSKFTVIFPLQQHDPIIESTPGQKTDESGKHKN
ncbi:MAG: ATP-binding protein, partial [Thermodesulfobacteriota bacterium]|nr:ATP-binding protein [Thermodesulfobacteriota bacterium]